MRFSQGLKNMPNNKKCQIELEIRRNLEQTDIYIKIPPKFESFFKKLCKNQKQTSTMWHTTNGTQKSAKFYKETENYKKVITPRINSMCLSLFDDYGKSLIQNNENNIAILRTVGASKGIYVTAKEWSNADNIDFEKYVRTLADFAKNLWTNLISEKKVTAKITFQI
ncbi:hypothetical protein CL633_04450 [bacterium]|jgi:hypothetical protein|nr:hypothetical protein [bacterium]|tara:strand:- start:6807 stop:7307 length:501 start_codon:yes stop_codon:yes gene_type:complete